ncbi:MAG: LON peptidase substrate-binding domain-containing protein, partial [Chromatiales bacterium]
MQRSRFFPTLDQLPRALPVFPLESVIVLPGADLPLNIFEPRYLNLVEDVLKTHHMFGMVQPDPGTRGSGLYHTGCAGRITAYSETDDERILLSLTGIIRFHIL